MTIDALYPLETDSHIPESDPLANLAAQLGTEDDTLLEETPCRLNKDDFVTLVEPLERRRPADAAVSCSQRVVYDSACAARGVEPLSTIQNILEDVPSSLRRLFCGLAPPARVGGAVVPAPSELLSILQVEAFLQALLTVAPDGHVLMLDHLSLDHQPCSACVSSRMIRWASALGPWWRLRSLSLRHCGLTWALLGQLVSSEAQQFMWHLQRLDISHNRHLGRNAEGHLCSPEVVATPDIMFLFHLWRRAPLRFLDVTDTDLGNAILTACLRMLRSYELPSSTEGVGSPLHDGCRPVLECIRLGPPGDGVWSDALLLELAELVPAAPQLTVLELVGAGAAERNVLEPAWSKAQRDRGINEIQVAEVRPGVLRFSAGTAVHALLPIEATPDAHTLPGPDTPVQQVEEMNGATVMCVRDAAVIDDWEATLAGLEHGLLLPANELQGVQPKRRSISDLDQSGDDDDDDGVEPIRLVHKAMRRQPLMPPRPSGPARRSADGGRKEGSRKKGTRALLGIDADGEEAFRGGEKRRRVSSGSRRAAPQRQYRGGLAEDELPTGAVDLVSDDDLKYDGGESDEGYEDDDGDDEGYEDEDSGGRGGASSKQARAGQRLVDRDALDRGADDLPTRPLAEPFRIRDGTLDEDSQMGRRFRADARRFIK